MSTYVETAVEERLRPAPTVPVLTKKCPPLLRTSSLEKIRRFPTYFCRQTSAEIYQWVSSSKTKLTSSKTKLSKAIADLSLQLQNVLLIMSIYAAVGVLAFQITACIIAVISQNLPFGLVFLLSCVGGMTVLAARVMPPFQLSLRRCRSTTRRPKQE